MSRRKHKGQGARTASAAGVADPRRPIERLIEKAQFKDALKQAKVLFRADAAPENRRLLERAWIERGRQLHAAGMLETAREVVQQLQQFGVTDDSLRPQFASLLCDVGFVQQAQTLANDLASPELLSEAMVRAADQAVLHPERTPASMREISETAKRIRAALEALDASQESRALDLIREIPRSSPFADWRLFVRGWAAHKRGDPAEASANWDRLEAGRPARVIAGNLRKAAEPPPGISEPQSPEALQSNLFGAPVLSHLQYIHRALVERNWDDVFRVLPVLHSTLRQFDPQAADRLTTLLIEPILEVADDESYDAGRRLISRLTSAVMPLSWDPQWHRLWGLLHETSGSLEDSESSWSKFAADVGVLKHLSPDDRLRAQAIVHRHMAELWGPEALREPIEGLPEGVEDYRDEGRRMMVQHLETSLQLDPRQIETWRSLLEARLDWDEDRAAAEVARRCLEVFPDDTGMLEFLTDHHAGRGDAGQALQHALRVKFLKPLDREAAHREFGVRTELFHQHLASGRWDQGRAELAEIERLHDEHEPGDRFMLHAKGAILEFLAGDRNRAAECLKRAEDLLTDKSPLWVLMTADAERFGLNDDLATDFYWRAVSGLSSRKSAAAAGSIARLLETYYIAGHAFRSREELTDRFVAYVKSMTRTQFAESDLMSICLFLTRRPDGAKLVDRLLAKGRKWYPQALQFPMLLAQRIMEREPSKRSALKAKPLLERALQLARASDEPRVADVIPMIEDMLSAVEEVIRLSPPSFLSRFFGGLNGQSPDDEFLNRAAEAFGTPEGFRMPDGFEMPDEPRRKRR